MRGGPGLQQRIRQRVVRAEEARPDRVERRGQALGTRRGPDAAAGAHTRGLSGVLRLHAPPVLATYVLAPLLAAFRERYPLIRLDVEVESTAAPPIEDFDITLLATDEHFDAGIVARKLIESEVMLVAAPAYLARRGVPATPQDLARHDCLRVRLPLVRTRTWVLLFFTGLGLVFCPHHCL